MNIKNQELVVKSALMSEETYVKFGFYANSFHPMDELGCNGILIGSYERNQTNDDFFDQMKRKALT